MASWNSKQYQQFISTPVQHIDPRENGRVRRVIFTWPQPGDVTSTPAAADTINLCWLPPGAQFAGGMMVWEANTSTATFSVGTAATATLYSGTNTPLLTSASTGSPAAGGCGPFILAGQAGGGTMAAPVMYNQEGNTLGVFALGTGTATLVIGTVGVATLTAGKRIAGHLDYIMD